MISYKTRMYIGITGACFLPFLIQSLYLCISRSTNYTAADIPFWALSTLAGTFSLFVIPIKKSILIPLSIIWTIFIGYILVFYSLGFACYVFCDCV
jgi:hypothetical protein